MKRYAKVFLLAILTFALTACSKNQQIISQVDEREANLIVVFLESKGISAQKVQAATSTVGGGNAKPMFNISVDSKHAIDAMAYLNQNGLPRKLGTDLLDLFAKQGLTTSDKEETIRYQAGLASQITNTILMIDGVIEASVNLSFPEEETAPGATSTEHVTAAVYVKHQGVVDDPNIHLENKIKRLVSGSVPNLDINDVTVVSDRSRFTDVTVGEISEAFSDGGEYVSIWSIVMSKQSAGRFRFIFFVILILAILFAALVGWILWKVYPIIRKNGGLKELINPIPITQTKDEANPPSMGEQPPGEEPTE
ncbi:MAG: EscJ/YscJ/HrcJ family type III secretion inner membrane ring protein [Simkaniaceae bacterium]|nr:EscJ/YscJ/HrcJ family type III secretion inner membrane ring protein [Simkaniaceae bacterium]